MSPSSASTSNSSTPQVGSRGDEKTAETVVWLQPASRARTRRLGQPARWCRPCSASTRLRCGPGGRSGRGRAPTWPSSRTLANVREPARPTAAPAAGHRSHANGATGPRPRQPPHLQRCRRGPARHRSRPARSLSIGAQSQRPGRDIPGSMHSKDLHREVHADVRGWLHRHRTPGPGLKALRSGTRCRRCSEPANSSPPRPAPPSACCASAAFRAGRRRRVNSPSLTRLPGCPTRGSADSGGGRNTASRDRLVVESFQRS